MREKMYYRDNLELIMQAFPNEKVLKLKQAADYLGIDVRTFKKKFKFNEKIKMISICDLARQISS